jgi:hypothetical protein
MRRHPRTTFLPFPCSYTNKKSRLVGETVMAKIIDFYIPKNFRKDEQRGGQQVMGRVIEFKPKKSA